MDPITTDIGGHPLQPFHSSTLWHLLSNYALPYRSTEHLYLAEADAAEADVSLARRLMTSYAAMRTYEATHIAPEDNPNSGIWEMTKHEFHGPFYSLIAEQDADGLARYLNNAMRETVTHGLGPGRQVFEALRTPGEGQHANIMILIDRLTSLAEAIGALRHENPEQGPYGRNATLSASDLVTLIEDKAGIKIGRPKTMGNFGIRVNDEIIDFRVPDDAYTMFRAKSIMDTFGLRNVAEIGGGIGGNALQAHRMGLASYKVFDIPVVSVLQGWFLIKTIGAGNVGLYGEETTTAFVKLHPYWEFSNRALDFDLVINRDSLPEIPSLHAQAYIDEIADRKVFLLSINQESCAGAGQGDLTQNCVLSLVERNGKLAAISRHRAWTRKGYVEELFGPIR